MILYSKEDFFYGKNKENRNIGRMFNFDCYGFCVSFIKIIDMPYGGAVTAASMLPIIIAGYRHGLKWGLITSFTYSILQLLTGLSNVSYATSTTAMIAIILLDYIVAFTVLGLLGVVKKNKHQTGALVLGTLIVCLLRYLCHFITGCTVWAGVSIPTADGALYSLVYNGAYMIPETVVTVYVMALVSNSIDLRAAKPVTREKSKNIMAVLNGVLVCGIAIIVDFLIIFRQIQTEDGFKITLITNTNWMLVGVILLVGVIVGGLTYVITKLVVSKKKTVLPRREN